MSYYSLQEADKSILHDDDLNVWVGKYEFYEFAEPHYNMAYDMKIYKEKDAYYADINIDGVQTMKRIKAKVHGDQENIDVIFEIYLPDNWVESYAEDDILFSFKMENGDLNTYWDRIHPMAYANEESGKIYFVKQKN